MKFAFDLVLILRLLTNNLLLIQVLKETLMRKINNSVNQTPKTRQFGIHRVIKFYISWLCKLALAAIMENTFDSKYSI